MTFWPGTKIPRSRGNAFDWRGKESIICSDKELKMSNLSKMNMAGKGAGTARSFTIYSKAKASK